MDAALLGRTVLQRSKCHAVQDFFVVVTSDLRVSQVKICRAQFISFCKKGAYMKSDFHPILPRNDPLI